MKREKNYVILEEEKVIKQLERNEKGCIYVFEIDKKEYYFKEVELSTAYLELFGEQIARSLNIDTVHYALAKYQGKIGVLSENYNPKHLKEITMKQILMNYYMGCFWNRKEIREDIHHLDDLMNLEDIWSAITYYYKDRIDKNEIGNKIMSQLVDTFLLQIFLGNQDLHSTQLSILDGKHPTLTPNHDYGKACLIDLYQNRYTYGLSPTRYDSETKRYPYTVVNEMLYTSESTFIDYFEEKLHLLPTSDELNSCLEGKFEANELEHYIAFFLKNYEKNKKDLYEILNIFHDEKNKKEV